MFHNPRRILQLFFAFFLGGILGYSLLKVFVKPPIRIGMNPWLGYEFLSLAKDLGFYKDEGVNVEIIKYSDLEDVRHGYEQGQFDVMASTIIETLMAGDRTGKPLKAFFVTDFSNGPDVLIVDKNVKTLQDLKGKKIGVESLSLGLYMLARVLDKAGLQVSDVNIVHLDQKIMLAAYQSDLVDGIISYPDTSTKFLKREKDVHILFSSADIPGEVADVLSADEAFLKERNSDVKKMLRAWDRAVDYFKKNKDKAYEMLSKKTGMSRKDLESALGGLAILKTKQQHYHINRQRALELSANLAGRILNREKYLKDYYEGIGRDKVYYLFQ